MAELTICPICNKPVTRSEELPFDHSLKTLENTYTDLFHSQDITITCENEFYIHYQDALFKILNPKTLWS
jgi:hypothetical protein